MLKCFVMNLPRDDNVHEVKMFWVAIPNLMPMYHPNATCHNLKGYDEPRFISGKLSTTLLEAERLIEVKNFEMPFPI